MRNCNPYCPAHLWGKNPISQSLLSSLNLSLYQMPNLNGANKIIIEIWGCHPGTFNFMQMARAVDCLIFPYGHETEMCVLQEQMKMIQLCRSEQKYELLVISSSPFPSPNVSLIFGSCRTSPCLYFTHVLSSWFHQLATGFVINTKMEIASFEQNHVRKIQCH